VLHEEAKFRDGRYLGHRIRSWACRVMRNGKLEGSMIAGSGDACVGVPEPRAYTGGWNLFLARDGAGELDLDRWLTAFEGQVRMVGPEVSCA
jgi:hypothetical protein